MRQTIPKLITPTSIKPATAEILLNEELLDHIDSYLLVRQHLVNPSEERLDEVINTLDAIGAVLLDEFGLTLSRLLYLQNVHGMTFSEVLRLEFDKHIN